MSWPLLPSSRAKTCMRYLPSGMKNCTACCPAVCTGSGANLRSATATLRHILPCCGLGSASAAARCFSMFERSLAESPASRVSMSPSPVVPAAPVDAPEVPVDLLASPASVVAIRFAPVVPCTNSVTPPKDRGGARRPPLDRKSAKSQSAVGQSDSQPPALPMLEVYSTYSSREVCRGQVGGRRRPGHQAITASTALSWNEEEGPSGTESCPAWPCT